MSDPVSAIPTKEVEGGTVTYEDARVVITPEAPYHYQVKVSDPDGDVTVHEVEYVVVNTTEIRVDDPIWFIDVELDIGIPLDGHGETVWVWT